MGASLPVRFAVGQAIGVFYERNGLHSTNVTQLLFLKEW
jgi:hypothetical protein